MLCYSTGSLPQVSIPEIADILGPSPFAGVELVITPEMLGRWDDETYWDSAHNEFHDANLTVRNVHLGHPNLLSDTPHAPALASPESTESAQKTEAILRCAEIATRLDSRHLTVTTGQPTDGPSRDDHLLNLYAALDKILKKTEDRVALTLEQEPEHVIHSTEQLHSLCQRFDGELFLTFDIGHSHVLGENIPECLETLAPYIVNIHLEDIKGRVHKHLLYGEGDIDFPPIFDKLKELGYAGDFTPDLYPFAKEHERAMEATVEFLKGHNLL